MTSSFTIGELSRFVLGPTTRDMSQELRYGAMSCLPNTSNTGNTTCADFNDPTACNSTTNGMCQWNYNGQGIEYQILAGPSFTFTKTIGGLVIGALADRYNRVLILALSTFLFNSCTILIGISQKLWQLIVLRMTIAFGQAACQVVPVSLVPAIFPKSQHGTALGIVNWGIYFGYGLSYVVGNYVPLLDIMGQGWRWCYYLIGILGLLLSMLLLFTATDPRKPLTTSNGDGLAMVEKLPIQNQKSTSFLWQKIKLFHQPIILLLLLGGCVRHTAGLAMVFNTQPFFDEYYPGYDIGMWLFGDAIVGGSAGIVVGGLVSDQIVKKIGLHARAWVLAGTQLLAVPFALGFLLASPPYSFLFLLGAYLFAETWFSILFAILANLVPTDVRSFTVAVFLFIMNNVGGNLPIIINPLGNFLETRTILVLLYPGGFFVSAFVFSIAGLTLWKSSSNHEDAVNR